jgi:class 3 adenylate cyclase
LIAVVICGAPTACTMNEAVAKVAKFGLDVVDCMSRFQTAKGLTMEVRCGMSSGPVVAGIVGTSMPRYDSQQYLNPPCVHTRLMASRPAWECDLLSANSPGMGFMFRC